MRQKISENFEKLNKPEFLELEKILSFFEKLLTFSYFSYNFLNSIPIEIYNLSFVNF